MRNQSTRGDASKKEDAEKGEQNTTKIEPLLLEIDVQQQQEEEEERQLHRDICI